MVERELPTNLAWIHAAVSEHPGFMDGGRKDDGRLRHDSSSADKAELKNHTNLLPIALDV